MAEDEVGPIVIADTATDRYATLDLISWWRQDVVRRATVMVVGAGALGNEVLKNLALMGVGRLLIVDFDTIEDANLSRSVLFRQEDRGRRKAEVAAERVQCLNPDVQGQALHADVNMGVGLGVFRRMDAIVGCVDNRLARLSINRACWHLGVPWVDGAIEALDGVARVFWPGRGACYECTLTALDWQIIGQRTSCPWLARRDAEAGKVPTTPTMASIIAGIQVQEVLKLLHGLPVAAGKGLIFNGRNNEAYLTEYPVRAECQSHWRFEDPLELPGATAHGTRVAELLALIREEMGEGACLELDQDWVTGWRCRCCGATEEALLPLIRLEGAPPPCPRCGGAWTMITTHVLTGAEPFADRTLAQVGIPPLHILVARRGEEYRYLELTGDAPEALRFR